MLETFIAEAKAMRGVAFERLDRYVSQWSASNP